MLSRHELLRSAALHLLMLTTNNTPLPQPKKAARPRNRIFKPAVLRCEKAQNPLGVDNATPRLSWQIQSARRGARQTAYRIVAASSEDKLRAGNYDLWDSGRVPTAETLHRRYAGRALRAFETVFWRVQAWDEAEKVSGWSETAHWTMGALTPDDWQGARWISVPALLTGPEKRTPPRGPLAQYETLCLRREFVVRQSPLRRALMLVSGLGQYEVTLNGAKVGSDLLTPGWTDTKKTILYDTYEVSDLLKTGPNAIGILLGNGFYNVHGGRYTKFENDFAPLQAICLLLLEYEDSTTETIGTDEAWRAHSGPITFSSVFGGEEDDARRELPGWNCSGFDAAAWQKTVTVESGPGGVLRGASQGVPPVRTHEVLRPVSIRPIRPGVAVYDLGQNASLMPRVLVKGPAGSVVRITPAELVTAEGKIDRRSCGGGEAYWSRTLHGRGTELYFPRFFYHGARYLEVECLPADGGGQERPVVEALEGVVVHTDAAPVGECSCSSDLFNRVHRLIRWAQRSNLMHLLTDCPHRERLGWLEQYHLNGPSLRYEFDLARLYEKCFTDMADAQQPNGLVPDIAPEYVVFQNGFRDSPEWGSALILSAWQQYEWTGDDEPLRRHYTALCRYVDYLAGKAQGDLLSHGLGDWYDIGPKPPGYAQLTPKTLTATAHYFMDVVVLARVARLLGYMDQATAFETQASAIKTAFNKALLSSGAEGYATGSQCANALPLAAGLVPEGDRERVVAALVHEVESRGFTLTTGDIGHRYLLRALAEARRSDVIYRLHHQAEKPGYGYQLTQGCTSLAEAWDAGPTSSQNHFMLGHLMEWFYHDLAGIGPDPDAPGFRKVRICPQPVAGVTWVRARHETPCGPVAVEWHTGEKEWTLTLTIPANTTATVWIPAALPESVTESGKKAAQSVGVRYQRQENGCAVYEIASGTYHFTRTSEGSKGEHEPRLV